MAFAGLDPAVPNVSRAPTLIAVPTPFFILGLAAYAARMYVRARRRKLGIDDGFLTAGVLCGTGFYAIYIVDVARGGLGRHLQYTTVPQLQLHAKISIASEDLYAWASTFVKVSLACTLVRIQFQRRWRYGLYALISIQFMFALACSLVNWLQCRPLGGFWDFQTVGTKCLSLTTYLDWIYTQTAFFMATDLILAVLPILLIMNVQMPRREKITVCILMGLGICAGFAAIPKLIYLLNMKGTMDWTWRASYISMFAVLEVCLGMIAVSNSANKGLLDAFLRRIGFSMVPSTTTTENGPSCAGSGFDDASTVLASRLSHSTSRKWPKGGTSTASPTPRGGSLKDEAGPDAAADAAAAAAAATATGQQRHKRQWSKFSQWSAKTRVQPQLAEQREDEQHIGRDLTEQHGRLPTESEESSSDSVEEIDPVTTAATQVGFKSALDPDFDLESRPWYSEHR